MAYFTLTLLPKLMAKYSELIQNKTEMRDSPKPFVKETLAASDILQPAEVINARESAKRPVNANWLEAPTSTSAAARVTTHTGPDGTSNAEALSWATLAETFSFSRQRLDDNLIGFDLATAMKFRKAVDKLMTRCETAGITFLESMKSGININNDQLGTWDAALDVFKVAAIDVSRSPYIGMDNMAQNNYDPMYSVIADNATYAKYLELMAQGQANESNNGWQLFNEFEMMRSNQLTPATFKGISYWYPKDSIGLLTWIPAANRRGDGESADSQNGILGVWLDPRYPEIEFAMSVYTTRTDTSASTGSTQDFLAQVELSIDYVYRKAELSTANETVIQALGQL